MSEIRLRLPPGVSPVEAAVLPAATLHERGMLSLGQAAELAGYSKRAFMEVLGRYSMAVFDDPAEDLAREIGECPTG